MPGDVLQMTRREWSIVTSTFSPCAFAAFIQFVTSARCQPTASASQDMS